MLKSLIFFLIDYIIKIIGRKIGNCIIHFFLNFFNILIKFNRFIVYIPKYLKTFNFLENNFFNHCS